jgi:hypothetical protein
VIARQEREQIRYFNSQTSMDDPDVVLQLYNRLVEREVFVTPVGISFLRELQEYLHMIPYIKNEEILPIPVYQPVPVKTDLAEQNQRARERAKRRRKQKAKEYRRLKRKKNWDYQRLFHVSAFFAVVFALVIAGMISITVLSGNNVTIINYENEIIDKYEQWEKELEAREEQLNQREQSENSQEE